MLGIYDRSTRQTLSRVPNIKRPSNYLKGSAQVKSRIVYTHIWQDENFVALTETAQRFVLYLVTNRTIGLLPTYAVSDREACFDLSCQDKQVSINELNALRKEIEKVGISYIAGYYVFENNFAQYEYSGGKTLSAKTRELSTLPQQVLEYLNNNKNIALSLGNHCPTIENINHKSEIINNKSYIQRSKIGQLKVNGSSKHQDYIRGKNE